MFGVYIVEKLVCFTLMCWGTATCVTITVPSPGFEKGKTDYTYIDSPKLPYTHAEAVCREEYDGCLSITNTQEEADRVKSVMETVGETQQHWIGLQWTSSGPRQLVWNDGQCTPVSRNNYRDDNDDIFQSTRQCYKTQSDLEWDAEDCQQHKAFICQSKETVEMNAVSMTLRVIQVASNANDSCIQQCRILTDCFMAARDGNTCIVGLASDTADTFVVDTGPGEIYGPVQESSNYFNDITSKVSNVEPNGCPYPGYIADPQASITWNVYSLTDSSSVVCPSLAPSTVYLTETMTATSREIVPTTTTMMSCSQAPTTVIESIVLTMTESASSCSDVTVRATPALDLQIDLLPGLIVTETPMLRIITETVTETCSPEMMTATVTAAFTATTTAIATATATVTYSVSAECSSLVPSVMATTVHNVTQLAESTDEIVKELSVDTTSLSKTVRAKTSAENKVTSAVVLGSSVSLICVGLYSFIFIVDFHKLIYDIRFRMIDNIRNRRKLK